ncbi:hypothetical protein [Oleiagrimonas soli]|uniref:Serine/threonine protein kinase n=1 Tax=Oleiagrimonas soli TaxID=1543381 RepID=A0A099CXM0_9GAMM|nr:hypothetical protein [Oleiagrimonas soli]KGI78362.1 hypothetical protein LF63_0104910 [Oleiagrimonas soli]MBB6183905.1 hypothetical protein [Oleiagrimonas soli]
MDTNDMKMAWQMFDRQLAQQRTLQLQLFRESRIDKLHRGLRPLVWGQSLQLLLGVLLATWAVGFWVAHRGAFLLLISGLLMQGFGLLLVMTSARVLALLRRIDYGAPVATIQRQLADLRQWRVRVESPVHAVVGSFIWVPGLICALATTGFHAWGPGLMWWAVSSVLVSVGLLAMAVWFARRHGYGARIEARAAGTSVQRARQALDELEGFLRD